MVLIPRKPLIAFRLDDDMYKAIKKAASNNKVSVGEFAREIVLRELGVFTIMDDPISESIERLEELREHLDKQYDKMRTIEIWCNKLYRATIYGRGVMLGLFDDNKRIEIQKFMIERLDEAVEQSLLRNI